MALLICLVCFWECICSTELLVDFIVMGLVMWCFLVNVVSLWFSSPFLE